MPSMAPIEEDDIVDADFPVHVRNARRFFAEMKQFSGDSTHPGIMFDCLSLRPFVRPTVHRPVCHCAYLLSLSLFLVLSLHCPIYSPFSLYLNSPIFLSLFLPLYSPLPLSPYSPFTLPILLPLNIDSHISLYSPFSFYFPFSLYTPFSLSIILFLYLYTPFSPFPPLSPSLSLFNSV
jgi:hypothetical protein